MFLKEFTERYLCFVVCLYFCISAVFTSCTKLDLATEAVISSKKEPDEGDPDKLWLVKSFNYSNLTSKKITKYDDDFEVGYVKVEDLKKGDVVHIHSNYSITNTELYRAYIESWVEKDGQSLGEKRISAEKGMKFTTVNQINVDNITEDTSLVEYKLKAKISNEYSAWQEDRNSEKAIPKGVTIRNTKLDGIFVVVYRLYPRDGILNDGDTPYYLHKLYSSSDVTRQLSCDEKFMSISSVPLHKDDVLILQGQVQLLTQNEGKTDYDYSIQIASELENFAAAIPGRKTTDNSNLPTSHKFFLIHNVDQDSNSNLSLVVDGPNCKFQTNNDYQHFSALVFRPVSKKNLKKDRDFYYLKSPEVQDYKTIFSKMPTDVSVNKNSSDASLIMSLDLGTIREHDILDIKLDSSFSLDFATDERNQYDFIYMFKYPSAKLYSSKVKGHFSPEGTSHIFNVKQDMSLYFSTEYPDNIESELLNLYNSIKVSLQEGNNYYNEYLHLNTFFILIDHWTKILDLDYVLDSLPDTDTDKEEENEEE